MRSGRYFCDNGSCGGPAYRIAPGSCYDAATMADAPQSRTLGEGAARQLSNTTKTPPQWVGISPRWLVQLLPWTPVEAGVYRLNRVIDDKLNIKCSPDDDEDRTLDHVRYAEKPREYVLSTCTKTIEVHT